MIGALGLRVGDAPVEPEPVHGGARRVQRHEEHGAAPTTITLSLS